MYYWCHKGKFEDFFISSMLIVALTNKLLFWIQSFSPPAVLQHASSLLSAKSIVFSSSWGMSTSGGIILTVILWNISHLAVAHALFHPAFCLSAEVSLGLSQRDARLKGRVDLANKNTGCSVTFEFQIHKEKLF